MDSIDDCQPCLGGYYCDTPGAIDFDFSRNNTGTGKCSPGYYCKSGKTVTMEILKIETPQIITITVLKMEQIGYTVQ